MLLFGVNSVGVLASYYCLVCDLTFYLLCIHEFGCGWVLVWRGRSFDLWFVAFAGGYLDVGLLLFVWLIMLFARYGLVVACLVVHCFCGLFGGCSFGFDLL